MSTDFVAQVKASVDLVKVVGEYVRLKKSGPRRYSGLCPFHSEKTPSFGVHPTEQFYKCFGCGAGGDLFKFVQEIEGVSFYEALRLIAEREGIPMPRRAEYSDAESRQKATLFELHAVAAQVFREQLESSAGAEAREYLARRGVKAGAVADFELGLSDRSGNVLLRRFERDGVSRELMEASGLISKHESGRFYDRFRGRLMFPIHDESGKVIAFGGRALAAGDEPKYLNSPETSCYKKSSVLYNLNRARAAIRKAGRAVLVEGYMDVIGVSSAGVEEVIATCGTALTNQQVRAIKRHSERIIVNFDPDTAGSNAAERSIQMLLEESMHVRVLQLGGGLDPDEYIKEHGLEQYAQVLAAAPGYFHWLADRARTKFDMRDPQGRIEAFKFLLPAVEKLNDKLERAAVANDIASYLAVPPGEVFSYFRRANTAAPKMAPPRAFLPVAERALLQALMSNEEARVEILPAIAEEGVIEELAAPRVFRAVVAAASSGALFDYAAVEGRLEDSDRELLASAVLADDAGAEVSMEECQQWREALVSRRDGARRKVLRAKIRAAEQSGNLAEALALAAELNALERSRKVTAS